MSYIFPRNARLSWFLVLCCLLAACGGGSGGSSAESEVPPPVAPTPVPPPAPEPVPLPEPPVEPMPGELTDFTLFESGPVRPLALSPDGRRLFVTNTPDNRLEIFNVEEDGLQPAARITPHSARVISSAPVWGGQMCGYSTVAIPARRWVESPLR